MAWPALALTTNTAIVLDAPPSATNAVQGKWEQAERAAAFLVTKVWQAFDPVVRGTSASNTQIYAVAPTSLCLCCLL